ncbi:MAG: Intracellular exo-alpha-(1-_5)-L-arabinofuranosidase [Tenericutes bacterium ADurb.Bin087]|nr:MAG: Intracellular exo-alpha-(1->5)-L-arabinofuranosidase [Tenericutes bacterium ADurb.Bin087]
MKRFKFVYSKNEVVGKTAETLHSAFIEHMGRAIYGGIYEPTHPLSDEDGFRKDVLEKVKKLNLSLIRYPGGNFVSGYFWEDGIGPREKRPQKREEAWWSIETNEIGTDEFMKWTKKLNIQPFMAVNLGAGTTESARNLVEYCNAADDSKYAKLRRKYGAKEPYGIKYWGLGNEMDGPWQIGYLSAEKYVEKAKEAAIKMRSVDPTIKLIGCGSSTIDMPTYPEWDMKVLDGLYDYIDYISVHQYFFESTTEADFFASHLAMDDYLATFRSLLNYVQTKHRYKKELYVCFDEYNIWYNNKELPKDYTIAPPILEEQQSMKDLLVFGGLTNSLLNNCDIVKISCIAQLVNVIAPILTKNNGPLLLNSIWYPYFNYCNYLNGDVLKPFVIKDYKFPSKYGEASLLSQSVTVNKEELVIQIVNYAKEDVTVEMGLNGFDNLVLFKHEEIRDDDLNAHNSFAEPYRIVPHEKKNAVKLDGEKIQLKLAKLSYNLIRFKR